MNTTPTPSSDVSAEGRVTVPLSVIIPTYNQRREVIQATLDALRAQTLPFDEWELIVVDNNSQPPLATVVDLSWHPHAHLVVETTPGVLAARSRGLRESRGELVLSVDDDNFLDPDYLAVALKLAREQPALGVWGGRIRAEYEGTPPPWVHRFAHHLAICEFEKPSWSSFVDDRSIPFGASMCIRRAVVNAYLERVEVEDLSCFGRVYEGKTIGFVAAEDQLVVYTATLIGFAVGRFPTLGMRHYIPSKKYDPEYFVKMVRGNAHGALLVQMHHGNSANYRTHLIWPILKYLAICLRRRGMERRILCAESRGEIDALLEMRRRSTPATLHVPAAADPAQAPAPLPPLSTAPEKL